MATTPAPGPPKLVNMYYLRVVGTPKPCMICSKLTTSCLANAAVTDFFYSCVSHLGDPGFAKPSPAPASVPAVPQAEIDRVKKEWEEKQARKKAAEETKDGKKESTWISSSIAGISSLANSTSSLFVSPTSEALLAPEPVLPAGGAKIFVLNRSIFSMRVEGAKKKYQALEARQRAEKLGLPSAPRGGLAPRSS